MAAAAMKARTASVVVGSIWGARRKWAGSGYPSPSTAPRTPSTRRSGSRGCRTPTGVSRLRSGRAAGSSRTRRRPAAISAPPPPPIPPGQPPQRCPEEGVGGVVLGSLGRRPQNDENLLAVEAELVEGTGVRLEVGQVVLLLQAREADELALPRADPPEPLDRDRVGGQHPAGDPEADLSLEPRELVVLDLG